MTPGSDDELLALYRAEATALLVFFERRVDDPELATDLLSETFARALRSRAQHDGSTREELSAWVWTIARGTLTEHQRRVAAAQRDAPQPGRSRRGLTGDEAARIEQLAGRERLRGVVEHGLSRLPEDLREAVRLRLVEDRSYEDVALELDVSVDEARTRVWRALRRLSAELERAQEDDAR